jgi:thiamine biosynthesis lipoprotein
MFHEFRDEIMTAQFSIRFDAPESEAKRLCAVAEEVFDEIHRLESLLSRFIEDSDIAQTNRLARGELVVVSPETFRCLERAEEATRLTDGRFDAAYLSPAVDETQRPYSLLRSPLRVRSEVESLHIDLGGIGKGFALEHVAPIPLRYDYSRVLLCADSSTMLALDPPEHTPGWAVSVERGGKEQQVPLNNRAVSCSGTSMRGEHIFDVKRRIWVSETKRCYVFDQSAALADAFSTAALTMECDAPHEGRKEQL